MMISVANTAAKPRNWATFRNEFQGFIIIY